MKNLRKIIALFIFIFIAGIIITAISINKTLDNNVPTETVEVHRDSLHTSDVNKTV